jgi:predicted metalloprotease
MSKKGVLIGIIIVVVAIVAILVYTNIFELAKPGIESSVDTAKDAISKVEGKDVVKKADEISTQVKNVTDQIEVTNPFDPKK